MFHGADKIESMTAYRPMERKLREGRACAGDFLELVTQVFRWSEANALRRRDSQGQIAIQKLVQSFVF